MVSEGVRGGGWWWCCCGGAYEHVDVFAEGAVGVRFDDAFECGAGVELWGCCHGGLGGDGVVAGGGEREDRDGLLWWSFGVWCLWLHKAW